VLVLASRQSGKTAVIRTAAASRAHHAELFGEPQEVLHVSRRVTNASKTIRQSWRWAETHGLPHTGSSGRERITWPDESYWLVSSDESVWGETASLAFLDEAWDLAPAVLDQAVMPTLVERAQPQVWLLSASNPKATALVPEQRAKAIQGEPRTLLLEWSPAPGDDLLDPAVWRACSPHWSLQRLEMMEAAKSSPGFAEQWLNRWPTFSGEQAGEWPPGWADCPKVSGGPPAGLTGALESSLDRSRYGVAVARLTGLNVEVWAATFPSLEQAQAQLRFWGASTVLTGASMDVGGPWRTELAGMKETRQATPALADMVRRGRVAHNHDLDVGLEAAGAQVTMSESGQLLSAHRSSGTVCGLKAAMWAAWAADSGTFQAVTPAIW
jgi:hypothetical protein